MRYFFILLLLFPLAINAQKALQFGDKSFKSSIWKSLKKDKPYSSSQVESKDNRQSLEFLAMGLHEKSCDVALVKISRYEYYQEFLSFVKESKYEDEKEALYLVIDHTLLPFEMSLNFQIPRVEEPGVYPFVFPSGFLKGLKGVIEATVHENRCFLVARANWEGPETKIPNSVFELFTQTLGSLTIKNLFRISKTMTF